MFSSSVNSARKVLISILTYEVVVVVVVVVIKGERRRG